MDLAGADLHYTMDLASEVFDLGNLDLGDQDFARQLVPLDLAGVDLLPPRGFCEGTFVAGTCVQAFFAPLSSCFVASGSCNQSVPGVVSPTFCWSSGAEFKQVTSGNALDRTFISGDVICFTEDIGGTVAVKTPWFAAGGHGLYYVPQTGDYGCEDGSSGNIGPNFGGCPALGALVAPSTTNCTAGACP
jgi:hypothetical protein